LNIILHNEVVILHIPAARFEGNDEDSDIIRVRDISREDLILHISEMRQRRHYDSQKIFQKIEH